MRGIVRAVETRPKLSPPDDQRRTQPFPHAALGAAQKNEYVLRGIAQAVEPRPKPSIAGRS